MSDPLTPTQPRLVLASSPPRRQALLLDAGFSFEVCPADIDESAYPAGTLPPEVERRIEEVPEVKSAKVELVWEPTWAREMMSEVARLELGM